MPSEKLTQSQAEEIRDEIARSNRRSERLERMLEEMQDRSGIVGRRRREKEEDEEEEEGEDIPAWLKFAAKDLGLGGVAMTLLSELTKRERIDAFIARVDGWLKGGKKKEDPPVEGEAPK